MTFGFFRARILTHFRAAAMGFEPKLPGSLAIVSIKVRFLAGSSLISPAEGPRRGGDLVRVVAEEAVAQVPALDLLRDGLRLIDLVICQGGTRLTEQGAGVLAIMGQRLSRLARAVGNRSGRLIRGRRSSRAGCRKRIALGRRFGLELAVGSRSGRLIRSGR